MSRDFRARFAPARYSRQMETISLLGGAGAAQNSPTLSGALFQFNYFCIINEQPPWAKEICAFYLSGRTLSRLLLGLARA